VSHEEAGHLHQNAVALGVAVGVVVLLEVVDVEVDASPFSLGLRFALTGDRIQVPAIVAAGERVPDTQLEKLGLQLFPLSDVDENPVTVLLSGVWIDGEESAVDDCSHFTIAACELEFDVPDGAVAFQKRHFTRSYFGFHEIAGARSPQILERFDAEHFQKSRIGVYDLAVQRRYVDSFLEAQCQLAERLGIGQIAETFLFSELGRGFGAAHIDASANGMSVALMEG
jgi:hypothetical protein